VVFAALLLALKLVLPLVAPQSTPLGVLGGPLLGIAIVIWWAFFSRVPTLERWGALGLVVLAMLITSRFLHTSMATGMMGYLFPIYALPVVALALVGWAVTAQPLAVRPRRVALVAAIVLACGVFALLRTEGFSGYIDQEFAWRWTRTPEERLLAQASDEPVAPSKTVAVPSHADAPPAAVTAPEKSIASPGAVVVAAPAAVSAKDTTLVDWPGFRGRARDGVVHGLSIATNWTATPPVEMWRRPIGPGWSSFAVHGDLIYTQEQRGDDEIVSAYYLQTGKPAWRHHDAARFWESNGGPGPRATPTFDRGRIYALGATGILNALDAGTGATVWSHNVAGDTGAKIPDWGFSGSPLLVDGMVVVATSGVLAAYDAITGQRRWIGPQGDDGYTSPQLMTIDGVSQIVHLSGTGLTSVTPADGTLLWQYAWKGYPIVQPSQTADGGILLAVNESSGIRNLAVTRTAGGWSVQDRWTSNGLKPWFNDFVVHKGHAFGFDGTILACIDLTDGSRKWKGGRYGAGQLVLLADQDLLLVISEEGELALVRATPDQFTELGRAQGITGKTWNHPVIAGDVLLVRNGEEMAAFRLAKPR